MSASRVDVIEAPASLVITVYGSPAPQGSKKFVGRTKAGRGLMVESSKAVKPWREAVKAAAIEALSQKVLDGYSGAPTICGPVVAEMTFTVPKPKSAPKMRRTWPDRKPDVSKLVRSTEDALTDAGVWEDDARVVDSHSRKVFPGEHPDALRVPGAVIRITSAQVSNSFMPLTGDLLQLSKSLDKGLTQVAE